MLHKAPPGLFHFRLAIGRRVHGGAGVLSKSYWHSSESGLYPVGGVARLNSACRNCPKSASWNSSMSPGGGLQEGHEVAINYFGQPCHLVNLMQERKIGLVHALRG